MFKGTEQRNCYEVQIEIFNFVYLHNFTLNKAVLTLGFCSFFLFFFFKEMVICGD